MWSYMLYAQPKNSQTDPHKPEANGVYVIISETTSLVRLCVSNIIWMYELSNIYRWDICRMSVSKTAVLYRYNPRLRPHN